MNKRTGTYAVGLLLAAGALSVSCGDDGNGGTPTAGTSSGGSAVAGSAAGGTSSGNGSGGSNAGTGGKAAAGDANLGGAAAGEGNVGGNDGTNGGMPGDNGGAPTSAGGESQGGMGGAPPEPTAGQGPVVDGGAGGAGGAGAAECLAVDEAPCESGVDAACTNDDGQFCFCFGQSDEWNCVEVGGQGGAGPGGFSADCGENPTPAGDCDGFGQCHGSPACFCLQGTVLCQ
jgi:hypothetical protein